VGGISKLGEEAISVMTPEFLNLLPSFFSAEVEGSVRSLGSLLRLCFAREPTWEDLCLMLWYSLSVPPWGGEALLFRSVDNDEILPKIRKPVLITHGAADKLVKLEVVDQHKARIPHAQTHVVANAGHAPFWDDADDFNRRLRAFAGSLQHSATSGSAA